MSTPATESDQPPTPAMEHNEEEQAPPPEQTPSRDAWEKDVKETGRWGSRSRCEVIAVIVAILAMIAVTFIGVYIAVTNANDKNIGSSSGADPVGNMTDVSVSSFQLPVKAEPVIITDQEELDIIIGELTSNSILSEKVALIPNTVAALAAANIETADPFVRAAGWITGGDGMNVKQDVVARFALATIFYSNGGISWTNATNWLLSTSYHCDWYGVKCCENLIGSVVCRMDSFGQVVELDLHKNNLDGPIPTSVVLLPFLHAMYLNDNSLSGSIPGTALASMKSFGKLYVQYNFLNGTVPQDLESSTTIDTIFIHGNNIIGEWPGDFCPIVSGMNCNKVTCGADCCSARTDRPICLFTEKQL